MVKVNGVTMIERMLSQLDKLNLSNITVVVGYKGKELQEYISTLNLSLIHILNISKFIDLIII